MMKKLISNLTILCLFITVSLSGFSASAQQSIPAQNLAQAPGTAQGTEVLPRRDFRKEIFDQLPPEAKRGAGPEGKAAWEKLTPEQRQQVKAQTRKVFRTYLR
jgi:hypothetical protein